MSQAIHRELTIPSRTPYLAQVRRLVLDMAGTGIFPGGDGELVALAVDEAVANVMEHAFTEDVPEAQQEIRVILDVGDGCFRALIRDSGRRFDPSRVPEVDIGQHVRQGRKGGLGIFLIRRIMDEVAYEFYESQYNELKLVKYYDHRARRDKDSPAQNQEGVSSAWV